MNDTPPAMLGEAIDIDLGLLFESRSKDVVEDRVLHIDLGLAVCRRNPSGIDQFFLMDSATKEVLIDQAHNPCELVVEDKRMEEGEEVFLLYRTQDVLRETASRNVFEMTWTDLEDAVVD